MKCRKRQTNKQKTNKQTKNKTKKKAKKNQKKQNQKKNNKKKRLLELFVKRVNRKKVKDSIQRLPEVGENLAIVTISFQGH